LTSEATRSGRKNYGALAVIIFEQMDMYTRKVFIIWGKQLDFDLNISNDALTRWENSYNASIRVCG
jgi:hypothetical protein